MTFLQVSLQVCAAALLAFFANRILESRKNVREHGQKIAIEARDRVRDLVECGAEYWALEISTENKPIYEAKIRLLEADVREILNLFEEEVKFVDVSKIRSIEYDLLATITGGNFESKIDRRKRSQILDIERATKLAAIGAKLRSEISRSWKRHIRPKKHRYWPF
jgi:hypothetical protein